MHPLKLQNHVKITPKAQGDSIKKIITVITA